MFELCLLEYSIIEKQNHKFIWFYCVLKKFMDHVKIP